MCSRPQAVSKVNLALPALGHVKNTVDFTFLQIDNTVISSSYLKCNFFGMPCCSREKKGVRRGREEGARTCSIVTTHTTTVLTFGGQE